MNHNKLYKCKYPECNIEQVILNKGLCSFHRFKQKDTQVKQYKIKQQSAKNKEKRKNKSEILKPYWEYHLNRMNEINAKCENCGCKIQGSIANIGHIIPKSRSIEICDDLNNCVYLCSPFDYDGQNCHARFDAKQNTSQIYLFNCWDLVVERYMKFRSKITNNTKCVNIFEEWIKENEISTKR